MVEKPLWSDGALESAADENGECATFKSYPPVSNPTKLNVDVPDAPKIMDEIRREFGTAAPLKNKRIAAILEFLFIPEEIKAYDVMITELGGEIDFASKLWGNSQLIVTSHVEGDWNRLKNAHSLVLKKDIDKDILPKLDSYAAVIFSANYCMKRLSWTAEVENARSWGELWQACRQGDLGRLVDAVMTNGALVKAFNCHAVWALMTRPEHARGLTMAFNGVMVPEANGLCINMAPNPPGQDIHLHTHSDGTVVSSASAVNGGTEALVRELIRAILK